FNHLLLIFVTTIVHLFHELTQEAKFIFSIVTTIRAIRVVLWNLEIALEQFIDRWEDWFSTHKHLWRDIVLHDQVRIKRVQVEGHNPFMQSNLWIFHVSTH